MRVESCLEQYLTQIAQGESGLLSAAIRILSNTILFVPVIQLVNLADEWGTNKIKIATFKSENRTVVPVFTCENVFLNWSNEKYQSFPVVGGDLAMTLPADTWIVINPGKSNSIVLSPDEVISLAEVQSNVEEPLEVEPSLTETVLAQAAVSEVPSLGSIVNNSIKQENLLASNDSGDLIISVLSQICEDIPEIQEAYYFKSDDGYTQAVIGLLTRGMNAELRFHVISEIAQIAKDFFGAAGAIDVYDDLHLRNTSSWELFKTLSPFYIRGDSEKTSNSRDDQNLAEVRTEKVDIHSKKKSVETPSPSIFKKRFPFFGNSKER